MSCNFLINRTGTVRINVKLRCVHETIVAVEEQKVLHIVSVKT